MYSKLQQQYIDSVDGKAHQSAIEIIGAIDALYDAAQTLAVQCGTGEEINAYSPEVLRVMEALNRIDAISWKQ